MISTGIFTGYFPYKIEETIGRIKENGFSCVQLDVSFKDCDAAREILTREKAIAIRDRFRDANLPVIAVSAYTNIMSPVKEVRKENIRYLKMMMERALDLGCPYVASETGTLNPESDWVWDEKNSSEEAFEQA
ncbi:MAG: TIM barrel protein, partial [Oscillospiraceae bacterium]